MAIPSYPLIVPSPLNLLQTGSNTAAGSATSLTISGTWGSTTNSGSLLVAVLAFEQVTTTGHNVSVTTPSGWTLISAGPALVTGSNPAIKVYYSYNASAQSNTGNWTFSVSSPSTFNDVVLLFAEYSCATLTPATDITDVSIVSTGTGPSVSPNVPTANAFEAMIFGVSSLGGQTYSNPTGGATIINQARITGSIGNTSAALCSLAMKQTGKPNASLTLSASETWIAALATIK